MKSLKIVLALILTLVVVASARYFGPNRKYRVEASSSSFTLSHRAPRGWSEEGPAMLELDVQLKGIEESDLHVELLGRVKGEQEWERRGPARIESGNEGFDRVFVFEIPQHPPATRYLYKFQGRLAGDEGKAGPEITLARTSSEPMMIKFKGKVPAWITILHVLAMFGGFFILILSAFYALDLARGKNDSPTAGRLAWWAWVVMFIGGVPLGFAMNYFAFNVLWEAFPFGKDVTDNKTQIALIIWGLAALYLTRRRHRMSAIMTVIAGVLVLALFLIPHSAQIS